MGPPSRPLGLVITQCVWDGGTARAYEISLGEALDTHVIKKKGLTNKKDKTL